MAKHFGALYLEHIRNCALLNHLKKEDDKWALQLRLISRNESICDEIGHLKNKKN